MTFLKSASSVVLVLIFSACGGTVGLGEIPDGGGTGGSGGGGSCGGLLGSQCPAGTYCDYAPTAACGAADQTGVCRMNPQVCTADCPGVCGCDGKFYCNACNAAGAGVDVNETERSCRRDQ